MYHKFYNKPPEGQPRRTLLQGQPHGQVASSTAKGAVVACLMRFCAGFWRFFAWSFSMLLELRFQSWRHVGYGVLKLVEFDGVENLD